MISRILIGFALAASLASAGTGTALAQQSSVQPPAHTESFPNLGMGNSREEVLASFEDSPRMERTASALDLLTQQRRLGLALNSLQPQRAGVIDAYVITVALDSDPVFAREARETGRVLASRYDANGRTITLAGPDGTRDDLPRGSIESLLVTLAHVAEVMDKEEDVLVLYTTSHGNRLGLAYHYGDTGYGVLSPATLAGALEELGIERRLVIISACYSGVFVPALASDQGAVLTAASAQRNSFGCEAENDWTFYGDALINRAMRQPQSLQEAVSAAGLMVAGWETERRLLASLPQSAIGSKVSTWLDVLEARMPQVASEPVGRPATGE
ncbi:MAG: C13 family peptidase [Pseudomonadota bacterium]